jgi:LacI family transcriptional regulator
MTTTFSQTTILDVAREAGVSPMTVSRALNRPEKVASETRNKVLAVCKRLNYRPNASARSLRTKTAYQVGVMIPDWRNAFWIDVVSGIEEVLTGAGFQLLIANSNEEWPRQQLQLDAMLSRYIDGLLIAPAEGSAPFIHDLQRAGYGVVVIDRLPIGLADVSSVVIDNEAGAYKATTHLIAEGHQRIGLLAGNVNLDTGRQRLEGYRRALQERGLPENDRWIRTAETNSALVGKQVGYEGTLEFLEMDDSPTALLCTSNTIAIGALTALHEREIAIPDDLAVVTFGNMEWTTLCAPSLTVITQPTFEMGRQAAKLLLELLESDDQVDLVTRQTILEPQLIVRASSVQTAIGIDAGVSALEVANGHSPTLTPT